MAWHGMAWYSNMWQHGMACNNARGTWMVSTALCDIWIGNINLSYPSYCSPQAMQCNAVLLYYLLFLFSQWMCISHATPHSMCLLLLNLLSKTEDHPQHYLKLHTHTYVLTHAHFPTLSSTPLPSLPLMHPSCPVGWGWFDIVCVTKHPEHPDLIHEFVPFCNICKIIILKTKTTVSKKSFTSYVEDVDSLWCFKAYTAPYHNDAVDSRTAHKHHLSFLWTAR